jgi:hypothetical protein
MKRLQNGILSVRDRRDFDHVALIAEVVSRSLAERTLRFSYLGQNFSFNDDFGMRRNVDVLSLAFGQRQRAAEQIAGDGDFIFSR